MNTTLSTFLIRFYIQKGKLADKTKAPIYVRITVNGEATSFFTKFHIATERWNTPEGRTLGRTREDKAIDSMLYDYRTLIKSKFSEMTFGGEVVTAHKIKMAVLGLDAKSMNLLDLCDRFITDYKLLVKSGSVTHCTYQRYVLTRERLAEYMREKYKMEDMPLTDINHSFIKGYDLHNRTQHSAANNTACRFIKHFRTMFNLGLNNGWVRTDPFASYKIHFEKVNRGYLTQQEINLMINKELSPRLEVIKDMFLFSTYTGLAYIDVRQLTEADLIDKEGQLWIITHRQKTNNPVHLRLLDIPVQIIEKYRGKAKGDRLLPIPCNQKVNDYLKEIAALCGIEKNLTFHLARHTFATTITLENGVPIETVSRMLGHTSIKTTQIYARITNLKIGQDMEALARKLNGVNNQQIIAQ